MRVVVVGGGIAGLAAARRLEQVVPDASVTLVESSDMLGGKLRTEYIDGYVIEAAADSFLSRKERGIGLVEELGLAGELIARRPEHQRTYVRRGTSLHPLPEGLTGMIPTNLEALDRSDLLSSEGKTRFAAEPDVPAASGDQDESVAAFVSRRFGREAYEALVEPLMTGIYGGDGEQMSLRATFPQLRVLEIEQGSLLRGMSAPAPREHPPFLSLRQGMGSLVAAVAAGLRNTELALGRQVVRVTRGTPDGYVVELADGEWIEADAVVLATPAFATAELLAELDDDLATAHAAIPYASSVVVTFAFAAGDVTPLDGYGYLVPRTEGSGVLACTWTTQKWQGRAPDGAALVRIYAGRFGERDLTQEDDAELVGLARAELAAQGVTAAPALTRVQRWPRAMPQYVLGHPKRLASIDAALEVHAGLAVAGAAYRGVGIPDCIRSGELAAESVAKTAARAHA